MYSISKTFKGKFPMPPFKPIGIDEGFAMLAEMLYGQFTGGRCVGGEIVSLTNLTTVYSLNVPSFAISALMVLVCDDASIATITATQSNSMAFFSQTDTRVDEVDVAPILHMPMGHMGVVEIKGAENMKNFRIQLSSNQSGVSGQQLRIEYFA